METKPNYVQLNDVIFSHDENVRLFLLVNGAYAYNSPDQYKDKEKLSRLSFLLDLAVLLEKISKDRIDYTQIKITWILNIPYIPFRYVFSIIPDNRQGNAIMCFANTKGISECSITFYESKLVSSVFLRLLMDSFTYSETPNETGRKYKTYLMIDNNTGHYKIGKSIDCSFREKTLQSQNPSIKLIGYCKQNIEAELHKKYASKRVRGEWFSLSDNDVADIMDLF